MRLAAGQIEAKVAVEDGVWSVADSLWSAAIRHLGTWSPRVAVVRHDGGPAVAVYTRSDVARHGAVESVDGAYSGYRSEGPPVVTADDQCSDPGEWVDLEVVICRVAGDCQKGAVMA
jgi:hypothetical protein